MHKHVKILIGIGILLVIALVVAAQFMNGAPSAMTINGIKNKRGCQVDADCTDKAKPECVFGTCGPRGCVDNGDCTDPDYPVCDNGGCMTAPVV